MLHSAVTVVVCSVLCVHTSMRVYIADILVCMLTSCIILRWLWLATLCIVCVTSIINVVVFYHHRFGVRSCDKTQGCECSFDGMEWPVSFVGWLSLGLLLLCGLMVVDSCRGWMCFDLAWDEESTLFFLSVARIGTPVVVLHTSWCRVSAWFVRSRVLSGSYLGA